ncbi:MAG: DUF4143 domain-containing protein [Lactobacillaceae bacterium]|nr:DUF4143 domain-containing protein [Lactobacillaceae bacterium]
MYKKRHIDRLIDEYLEDFPVVLVEGAKAVGKTASCERVAKTTYYLDEKLHYDLLSSDPSIVLTDEPPVLLDEWQKIPSLWDFGRRAVDRGLSEGQLLMTGSNPIIDNSLHSGAGRIVRLKMRPYSIEEREMSDSFIRISDLITGKIEKVTGKSRFALNDYLEEIFRSGYPAIRTLKPRAREIILEDYVQNIIDKEFSENGFKVKKPDLLLSWLKSYSAAMGTTTSFSKILETAMANRTEKSSRTTVDNYRDALQIINVIEELESWPNYGKLFPAISKAPKHFLVDPSFVTPLLGITAEKLGKGQINDVAEIKAQEAKKPTGKLNKSFLGHIIEAFVYQSLATYCEVNRLRLSHLRLDKFGKEIDFIVEDNKHDTIIAIEVKSASSINNDDVQHLTWFEGEAKSEYKVIKVILYTGEFAYTRQDGVHVIPIAMLGA